MKTVSHCATTSRPTWFLHQVQPCSSRCIHKHWHELIALMTRHLRVRTGPDGCWSVSASGRKRAASSNAPPWRENPGERRASRAWRALPSRSQTCTKKKKNTNTHCKNKNKYAIPQSIEIATFIMIFSNLNFALRTSKRRETQFS